MAVLSCTSGRPSRADRQGQPADRRRQHRSCSRGSGLSRCARGGHRGCDRGAAASCLCSPADNRKSAHACAHSRRVPVELTTRSPRHRHLRRPQGRRAIPPRRDCAHLMWRCARRSNVGLEPQRPCCCSSSSSPAAPPRRRPARDADRASRTLVAPQGSGRAAALDRVSPRPVISRNRDRPAGQLSACPLDRARPVPRPLGVAPRPSTRVREHARSLHADVEGSGVTREPDPRAHRLDHRSTQRALYPRLDRQ